MSGTLCSVSVKSGNTANILSAKKGNKPGLYGQNTFTVIVISINLLLLTPEVEQLC